MTEKELRELDAEVHRKVFGRTAVYDFSFAGDWIEEMPTGSEWAVIVPYYSTNIAEAWLVVEELVSRGIVFIVKGDGLRTGDYNPKWTVFGGNRPRTDADTAQLAICRAALAAVSGGGK